MLAATLLFGLREIARTQVQSWPTELVLLIVGRPAFVIAMLGLTVGGGLLFVPSRSETPPQRTRRQLLLLCYAIGVAAAWLGVVLGVPLHTASGGWERLQVFAPAFLLNVGGFGRMLQLAHRLQRTLLKLACGLLLGGTALWFLESLWLMHDGRAAMATTAMPFALNLRAFARVAQMAVQMIHPGPLLGPGATFRSVFEMAQHFGFLVSLVLTPTSILVQLWLLLAMRCRGRNAHAGTS
ncbi:MAG: hypothetical protein AAGK78_01215 [Planctomycetota bacterium]